MSDPTLKWFLRLSSDLYSSIKKSTIKRVLLLRNSWNISTPEWAQINGLLVLVSHLLTYSLELFWLLLMVLWLRLTSRQRHMLTSLNGLRQSLSSHHSLHLLDTSSFALLLSSHQNFLPCQNKKSRKKRQNPSKNLLKKRNQNLWKRMVHFHKKNLTSYHQVHGTSSTSKLWWSTTKTKLEAVRKPLNSSTIQKATNSGSSTMTSMEKKVQSFTKLRTWCVGSCKDLIILGNTF